MSEQSQQAPPVEIDIVSDIVCPWCFVGKRQLEAAIGRWQQSNPGRTAPVLRWRAFQLNPDLPTAGIARAEYLRHKFGPNGGPAIYDRVRSAASLAGLDLALERITRQPNTLKAHALVELAAETGLQTAMVEALFQAYFQQGGDLTDDAVLRALALAVGLPEPTVDAALTGESVTRLVAAGEAELREYGVNGVPLFIIGREGGERVAISGAQGADALLSAIRQVDTAIAQPAGLG
jgi:predicted DsbA family dithiol-disulfide isomerase